MKYPGLQNGLKKTNWKNDDFSLYVYALTNLLSATLVPNHLLQCTVPENYKKDLCCYQNQIIKYLRNAEAVAVLFQLVRRGTQKPILSFDPILRTLKNKAKFFFNMELV